MLNSTQSPWVIATRESRLALWQAEYVRELLQTRFQREVKVLGMTTRGDQILDRTLAQVGGKGLFVKELEVALQSGQAQLAVHSLKDVPMELPAGFQLIAILASANPLDAFVSPQYPDWQALPVGAKVGTSSLRRLVQLKALRPDLCIEPLRGNLDTRLAKLDAGHYDAIVLAAAGLERLGLAARIRSCFSPDQMLPAAGQGALAIEVFTGADSELETCLSQLKHGPTWLAAHAERAVARALGGGCSMPLAAFGSWENGVLCLQGALGSPLAEAGQVIRQQCAKAVTTEAEAEALGQEVAELLRQAGADKLLNALRAV